MNLPLLQARQTKYVAYVTLYIAVVVAIITVANVLGDRYNKTYDATANKRYSLSEQTAKIVKGLKEPATIYYYDRPTGFSHAKDTLEQYSNLSPKVHVQYVDLEKNPLAARAAGVKSLGTAVVEIGTRKEEANGLTEEGITGAFIRDLKSNKRTICFVTGSGEHQIDETGSDGYSRFKDLLGKAEVPTDCTVLVVAGPKSDQQQPEVDAIKKYVEDGGRAMFLLNPPLKMGRTEIADNDALSNSLESWGVTPDKDLILDLNPIGQLAGLGYQDALVTRYDSHEIVNTMKGTATAFPYSRSLEVKNGDKTTVDKLFESSESSLATEKLDTPRISASDPKNKKGPLILAAAGSYRTGKENSQGRFVVVGSSDWVANAFLPFNGNRDLAMNAINWLASDEELISIRPKDRDMRTITMTRSQLNWVGMTSLGILPLGIAIAGVW